MPSVEAVIKIYHLRIWRVWHAPTPACGSGGAAHEGLRMGADVGKYDNRCRHAIHGLRSNACSQAFASGKIPPLSRANSNWRHPHTLWSDWANMFCTTRCASYMQEQLPHWPLTMQNARGTVCIFACHILVACVVCRLFKLEEPFWRRNSSDKCIPCLIPFARHAQHSSCCVDRAMPAP